MAFGDGGALWVHLEVKVAFLWGQLHMVHRHSLYVAHWRVVRLHSLSRMRVASVCPVCVYKILLIYVLINMI